MSVLETLYDDGTWSVLLEEATLPDGRTKKVTRLHRCDSAHILAQTDAGKILMLREYRPYYGEWIWMIPSGRVDKETDIVAAARRELREETGFDAASIVPLWTFQGSESIVTRNHVFLAKGLDRSPLPQDEDELMETHECTVDEAIENVLKSPVVHTLSAAALLRWKREGR